mgnify:CR=1 FL=1
MARELFSSIEKIKNTGTFKIENKQLDDCWILNSDKVLFQTPKYQIEFSSSAKENFLQAYTPPKENAIAIEPTTGVSDSFNNKIGLQTLEPNKEHILGQLMLMGSIYFMMNCFFQETLSLDVFRTKNELREKACEP